MRRPLLAVIVAATLIAQNKPERLELFRVLGFGLFIHWSFDSQIDTTISHAMVGADQPVPKR